MKNFKKLIAMGVALVMAAAMNVAVLADGTGAEDAPFTDAYDEGAVLVSVIKAALPEMADSSQYTVVVVPVGEEISDSNIYYINQAAGNDAVWATTTTWGTPSALADGDYVVRVGDEAGNVEEIFFSIGSTQEPPAGDPVPVVTFMNGATTFATVDTVDGKAALPTTDPTLEATAGYIATAHAFVEWVDADGKAFTADTVVEADTTVYPKFKAQIYKSTGNIDMVYGDVTNDGKINRSDRTAVMQYVGYENVTQQVTKPISPLLVKGTTEIPVGDVTNDGKINRSDRTAVMQYVGYENVTQQVTKLIYVVNK